MARPLRSWPSDLYRNEFWKYAGAESIADRMAVAATLGETNPAAQSAWMHGADVIREMYGIDLQKINRGHPNSQEERHAALRDVLDDRLQMNQLDTQADRVRESAPAQDRPAEQPAEQPAQDGEQEQEQESAREEGGEAEPAQDAEELEADSDRERMEEGEALERADRAEDAARDDDAVVDTDGLAARRDFARERAEEAETAPKTPEQRAAETERVNLELLEQTAPELVQVRVRQLQSFALNPSKALEASQQRGRRPRGGQGAEQERQEVLSR